MRVLYYNYNSSSFFLGPKEEFTKFHPQEVIQWLDDAYEVSVKKGDGVLKSELFEKAANHFNIERNTLNQRAFFEYLGLTYLENISHSNM